MPKTKVTIALILLASFILPQILTIKDAQAQNAGSAIGSVLVGGISCVATGKLTTWLMGKISEGLTWLTERLPAKLGKFLGLDTTYLAKLFNQMVPVEDSKFRSSYSTKETLWDLSARCFAREVMNDLTARMIGSARTSGRDGRPGAAKPAFVRDWRKFLTNAQQRGENIFRSVLSTTPMCAYFDNKLKTVYRANNQPNIFGRTNIRTNNLDPFTLRARCTMPRNWALSNYVDDFAGNGGWQALVRLAEPQNNFFGAMLLSAGELAAQRALEEDADKSEGLANNAFESRRGKPGDDCVIRASNSQCIVYKEILTPGSILQQSVAATVQQELAWIANVDEWEELISYLMTTIMSRILNLSEPSQYDQEAFPGEQYGGPYNNPYDLPDDSSPPPPPPSTCNNGFCEAGEDHANCPADCTGAFCDGTDANSPPDGDTCDVDWGENTTNCPSDCKARAQCENATLDTNGDGIAEDGDDDGDGLVDHASAGWVNGPDPGCSGPADNSEEDTVITVQCNDGFDNDGDSQTDYPADSDCSSSTDNSEITFIITLCPDVSGSDVPADNNGSTPPNCIQLTSSVADLNSTALGQDTASTVSATPVLFSPGFIVRLCTEPNFGNCTQIDASNIGSGVRGLSGLGLDNNVSSVEITQP
jgi:hypothetical protein